MPCEDARDDGESEAVAGVAAAGDEGGEEALWVVAREPGAVVFHHDDHRSPFLLCAQADGGSCVSPGVAKQVQQHPTQQALLTPQHDPLRDDDLHPLHPAGRSLTHRREVDQLEVDALIGVAKSGVVEHFGDEGGEVFEVFLNLIGTGGSLGGLLRGQQKLCGELHSGQRTAQLMADGVEEGLLALDE